MADQAAPERLGRYEIVRVLGKGAMGVVYEGRDPKIGRRVAIKTARRDVMEASGLADEMMQRFLREAQAAGALNHPNIVTIYDADEENGVAYIAMEFIEGSDLRALFDTRRDLTPEDIADIGATICDALAVAHDHGVVHRDIKPANVFRATSGIIKVGDFGIAHVKDSNLTQDGALIGTPHYMSPEQFMGQKLDGRSDLFSVGIILYEILTGEKPFGGEALSTVMHHCIKTMPVPPKELNLTVSDALSGVIMKALAKRPQDRYGDGRAMAAALRESVKPRPDESVLGFPLESGGGGTVVSRADDATMVVGANSETVAKAAPVRVATSATVAGGPPPGVLPQAAGLPSPTPSAAPVKSRTPLIAAGAGVAVLLVAVVGWMALGAGGGGVPATEPHYAKVSFNIIAFSSLDAALRYNDTKSMADLTPGTDYVEIKDATIVLSNASGEFQRLEDYSSGAMIPLSLRQGKFNYTIHVDGYGDENGSFDEPEVPEKVASVDVLLTPADS